MAIYRKKSKSYFSPISMLGNSRVIFHVVTAITLLSLIQNIKQQILMQKLLRSSNMSCSKPFITLLKQQISNCCSGKNTRAMLCIAYAHSAYDYARLMWIAVEKQCALPVYFFPEQQFDICCFRSVMKGLLQLMFELRRSFCINCR